MAKNTVTLKNYLHIREEYVAAAAITPGHLVELASTGKVQVHSSAGENTLPMFAVEDELQGNGIADAYSADDQVQVWIPTRGDQVYGLLANGQNVAIGAFLESAGDGTLQEHTPDGSSVTIYSNQIVGVALEAVDMSDSSGADPSGRIKVRII